MSCHLFQIVINDTEYSEQYSSTLFEYIFSNLSEHAHGPYAKGRRRSTSVYIDARAPLTPLGTSFGFKVFRSDFEVDQLPHAAFHKKLGQSKSTFLSYEI